MKLLRIKATNYKTYKELDLDLNVTNDRPIILVGGANGCGKTTLFDAIYHALYGLEIKNKRQFEEIFNSGTYNEIGMEGQVIELEIEFSGKVLTSEMKYKLNRQYKLHDNERVLERVQLDMAGNRYMYGSGSTARDKAVNEEAINKLIAANLPAELSNYFLFDAMKTSDLVKEEQINKLIMKNINSVMGFSKYEQLRAIAQQMLDEKKAERLQNESLRNEYQGLLEQKNQKEREQTTLNQEYEDLLNYVNDNKEEYDGVKAGKNADEVTQDQIKKIKTALAELDSRCKDYRTKMDNLLKDFETQLIYAKLADTIRTEVEVIGNAKQQVKSDNENRPSEQQLKEITSFIVNKIENQYQLTGKIDQTALIRELRQQMEANPGSTDPYPYLKEEDVNVLMNLVQSGFVNQFILLQEEKEKINMELSERPKRTQRLVELRKQLKGNDYTFISLYEEKQDRLNEVKADLTKQKEELAKLEKQIARYDYDMPQEPDPQYDMLCKLPDFFKTLSSKLLQAKKANIERMMKEQLNLNLVIYAGVIDRVELSAPNSEEISFKIYHKGGNEIYLSQLNAGAKQTVMQVLLKVLYNLGDYEPPVMIDTVMGVLDKESRQVILNNYFPDLAHQTILLSTDTEITPENDFEVIQAFVAHAYTLHRDKDLQCTTISEDYFNLTTHN
ncbi:MAG: AAA family ATPase [Bacteroidales bacterium]|nr:AAA family ATPase [Bacteroidales bacterium]